MDIQRGSLVYSIAGRDKGTLFLVLEAKDNLVWLSDGKTRQVEKPKKKKIRHINKTNTVLDIADDVTNSDVRKALAKFKA